MECCSRWRYRARFQKITAGSKLKDPTNRQRMKSNYRQSLALGRAVQNPSLPPDRHRQLSCGSRVGRAATIHAGSKTQQRNVCRDAKQGEIAGKAGLTSEGNKPTCNFAVSWTPRPSPLPPSILPTQGGIHGVPFTCASPLVARKKQSAPSHHERFAVRTHPAQTLGGGRGGPTLQTRTDMAFFYYCAFFRFLKYQAAGVLGDSAYAHRS